jgi:CubicO group peptidase (beta-lactamase class C family)
MLYGIFPYKIYLGADNLIPNEQSELEQLMQPDDFLIQTIDNLVQKTYEPTEPGVAVIVVSKGKVIFRKGYGMANLELGVPIEPNMVFRLGSLTKQFTAVAILMLAEQGKLAIDNPITKFLTNYPTHDHLITVEHLLTHTSGIRSYTDMPEWLPLWRKDFKLQELIDFFKYQPMQFAPGKRWAYNNSGYILLGAIIENLSGQTYEQFIQQNIFDRLGMRHSYYDNSLRIIPQRVSGYDKGPEGYTNADYLSMTQPYAAGALASTVDDLAIWDMALYTEQLLKQESLQRAFISHRLLDGSSAFYGYGWAISEYKGCQLIEHGGGINGFRTYAIRVPDERFFVAVLSNNGGGDPGLLAFKISTLTIGKPYEAPIPVAVSDESLARYEGVYQTQTAYKRYITREDNQLFVQFGQENPRFELIPFSSSEFFLKGDPLYHLTFVSDTNGDVKTLQMCGRYGIPEIASKVDHSAEGDRKL